MGLLLRLVKGLVQSTILLALIAAGVLAYGYYRLATSRLEEPEGAVVTAGLSWSTASLTGATLPVTFDAYVKDTGRHNWLDGGSAGLVKARYEWSHGRFAWVEDRGFAERQAAEAAARARIARGGNAALVRNLRSDDAATREVSAKELYLRTRQTLGYAYDVSRAERDKAADAWDRWLAGSDRAAAAPGATLDDAEMLEAAKRVLQDEKALDTLNKALGGKR